MREVVLRARVWQERRKGRRWCSCGVGEGDGGNERAAAGGRRCRRAVASSECTKAWRGLGPRDRRARDMGSL